MLDHIISAAIGVVAGGIGSVIAPWVNWGIEKKRLKLASKREQIAKWRKMVEDVTRTLDTHEAKVKIGMAEPGLTAQQVLERNADFYSLKPHLSKETLGALYGRTILVGSTIDSVLAYIVDDIGRIETKWDLV